MFVQLPKAYGLREQICVMFADTGSCGNMIELIQGVLWDLEITFSVLLSAGCVVVYDLYLLYDCVCGTDS